MNTEETIDANTRMWGMLAHLAALFGSLIGITWLGPLLVYVYKKDLHPFVAEQSRAALNFNISMFVFMIAIMMGVFANVLLVDLVPDRVVLTIHVLSIIGLLGLALVWLVQSIKATICAHAGRAYRYPMTIKFVR